LLLLLLVFREVWIYEVEEFLAKGEEVTAWLILDSHNLLLPVDIALLRVSFRYMAPKRAGVGPGHTTKLAVEVFLFFFLCCKRVASLELSWLWNSHKSSRSRPLAKSHGPGVGSNGRGELL
jgi:hypothetical protein